MTSAWLPADEITATYRVTEATLTHFSQRGNLPARGLTSSKPRYSLNHVDRPSLEFYQESVRRAAKRASKRSA